MNSPPALPIRSLRDEPPAHLIHVLETFQHPALTGLGLTAHKGEWALLARTTGPTRIPELEAVAAGAWVEYEIEDDRIPVARPAYPARNE